MFNIPNILTASNLICGVLGIAFALTGRIDLTAWLVFVALIFDFLDGFLARQLNQFSELGKQLDSLADMITFGVLPGIICFVLLIISGAHEIVSSTTGLLVNSPWLELSFGQSVDRLIDMYFADLTGNPLFAASFHFTGWFLFVPFVALLIPFLSLFRLAKFNIDTRQSNGFIGLPTPANAVFFTVIPLMLWDSWGEIGWKNTLATALIKDSVLTSLIVLFSFLLVAELPMISLKFKTFKWAENKMRYVLILISCVLIITLCFWAIPIILFLYIILSVIDNSQRKNKVTL